MLNLIAPIGIIVTVLLEVIQQLAFKCSAEREKKFAWMLLGASMYVPQQACWMLTLTVLPLAIATPFLGASYVAVPFASVLLFKEKIDRRGWLGICLILAGICLITREIDL